MHFLSNGKKPYRNMQKIPCFCENLTNDFAPNRLVAGFLIEYTYKHKIPCAAAKFGHACSHGLLRGRNV